MTKEGHAPTASARLTLLLAMGLVTLALPLTHLAQPGSGWALGANVRGRLNGLYMATIFLGGVLGSAFGAWTYAHGGWAWASGLGTALPMAAMAYWTTEKRSARFQQVTTNGACR